MQKIAVILLMLFYCFAAYAQKDTAVKESPSWYLSASTGINNNVGMYGLSFEKTLFKDGSIEAGIGMSKWGYKLNAAYKIYFKPYMQKWSFTAGLTMNTGHKNKTALMNTTTYSYQNGLQQSLQYIAVDYLPQLAGYAAMYYYYPIGRRVRLYIEFGWSLCFTQEKFKATNGTIVNDPSNTVLLFAPGGPILAGGVTYSVRRHK